MDSNIAIEARHASKIYELRSKEKKSDVKFYALKDLNFEIKKGQVVGILGTNGSGKSTMSIILAGICDPDEGEIIVNGTQALIAINTGLNAQLTGLENIELKGALLGLSKKRIEEIKEGVINFAEIGDFLYQPVKKYSSGMKSRLGFSVATLVEPDILILDEVLSVGDAKFRKKSEAKIMSMFDKGVTVLFVSHSLDQVKRLCNKAILLEKGKIISHGSIEEVSKVYEEKTK